VNEGVRVETERLVLLPFGRRWREDLIRLHRDPVVARWLFPERPSSEREEDDRIAYYQDTWRGRGYGCFAVIDKISGVFLGRAGPVVTPETGRVEIVWSLLSTVHGRGLATEAARASIDFTWTNSNLPMLEAYVRPDNTASRRVAEKCGFRLIDERFLYAMTLEFYQLPRPNEGTRTAAQR
jgi:RimJ/RimL family protein N-acetyltransferase